MAFHLPAQNDFAEPIESKPPAPLLGQVSIWLYLLTGAAITAFIWTGLKPAPEPMNGSILTGLLWIMVLAGIVGRAQSRRLKHELESALAFEHVVVAPRGGDDGSLTPPAARLRHVSAWLVLGLGLAATGLLWQFELFRDALGEMAPLIVGASVTGMFALAVAATTVNRFKTRRMASEFAAARESDQSTREVMRSLDVMISTCLPTGERTEFNERYLAFLGRSLAELKGLGWLEYVRPEDRPQVLESMRRPPAPDETSRVLDYCVHDRTGTYRWIRETLAPRRDAEGRLAEFIGAAVDFTDRVNGETALDQQIKSLRDEVVQVRDELSRAEASRDESRRSLEEARGEIGNLNASIRAAETRIGTLDEELATVRADHQAEILKNEKLFDANGAMKQEIAELRAQEDERHTQIASLEEETRRAKAEAATAREQETELRAMSNRLTQRCEALETKLSQNSGELEVMESRHEAELAERDARIEDAGQRLERMGREMIEETERIEREARPVELAGEFRRQLDGLTKMIQTLFGAELQGPHREAINNTAAAVRSMTELVDQALGRASSVPKVRKSTGSSFDLRQTMQGVKEFLKNDARLRDVGIEIDVASNVPALVNGDDVALRSALMSLTAASMALVGEGTLAVRLTEDATTADETTIRCEIGHARAKTPSEAIESMLALNSTDDDLPDPIKQPIRHQAAQAWRVIRQLDGSHGFNLPEQGGFIVWCTFRLGRVASAPRMHMTPAPATAAPSESAASMAASPRSGTSAVASPAPAPGPKPDPAAMMRPSTASATDDARSRPRLPQEFLPCNLGDVVELGVSGIRVHGPKATKNKVLTVSFEDLELKARVDWSKKISGRKYDVGLFFVDPTETQKKRILAVAMAHRRVTTMLDLD